MCAVQLIEHDAHARYHCKQAFIHGPMGSDLKGSIEKAFVTVMVFVNGPTVAFIVVVGKTINAMVVVFKQGSGMGESLTRNNLRQEF